jgi:hypothetical protein
LLACCKHQQQQQQYTSSTITKMNILRSVWWTGT